MTKSKTIGEILKEAREKKGLLLRQVAALIESDTALISKFEKNERKPTKKQIARLSKVLDINQNDLMVLYLSEKIMGEIGGEKLAQEALKVVEEKIKHLKKVK
jgi:transcriptional regulator with XRE-family HTH domain